MDLFAKLIFPLLLVLLLGCDSENKTSVGLESQRAVWDDNSVYLSCKVVGEGPAPIQDPMYIPQPHDPACQLKSKTYEYDHLSNEVFFSVCEDVNRDPRKFRRILSESEQASLIQLFLKIAVKEKKRIVGKKVEIGCHPDIRETSVAIYIRQKDGNAKYIDDGKAPYENEDLKSLYADLPQNLEFLNKIEELAKKSD